MSNLYKCTNCGWLGSVDQMIDTYDIYTDDWGRDCEEGSPYSCPNCGESFSVSWNLYELDRSYEYISND